MDPNAIDAFVSRVLHHLLSRHTAEQVYLFGPAGEPFWCARTPLTPADLRLLEDALGLIGSLENARPKPFIGHDAAGRFSVAALATDSDLYVVCVNHGPDRLAAEARVALMRDELEPQVQHLRTKALREAAGLYQGPTT